MNSKIKIKNKMSTHDISENKKSANTLSQKELHSKYYSDPYFLECQALINGFGKMINARNQSNPKYSFSKQPRFFSPQKIKNLPFIKNFLKNENINCRSMKKNRYTKSESDYKNLIVSKNDTNNNLYKSKYNIKYPYVPKWSFSKSERPFSGKKEIYEYYKLPYNKNCESEKKLKKWDSRIIGGNIGMDKRFTIKKNFKESGIPGPGKYNPNYCYFKYKKNNYGYMGIKVNDINKENDLGIFNVEISPVTYNNNLQIGSNVNNFKFSNGPKFLFSKSKKYNEKNKECSDTERYLKYSAFGEQVMAQKNSRPIYSFNKSNRINQFKNRKKNEFNKEI